MDIKKELSKIAEASGGIISNKSAEASGISRAMLSRLNKAGIIERIAAGQYIFPNSIQDDLLSINNRSENTTFSHETALWLHGISDRTPFVHSVTAPTGKIPSRSIQSECKVYYVKPELFEIGKTTLKTPSGNYVATYDLERTICDCIRSRNKMGSETVLAAMKAYSNCKDKNLNLLFDYATKFRVASVLRQYLEVLL